MRAKVMNILSDSSYKEKAMRMRERMRSYGGEVTAADLIESFIHELR